MGCVTFLEGEGWGEMEGEGERVGLPGRGPERWGEREASLGGGGRREKYSRLVLL